MEGVSINRYVKIQHLIADAILFCRGLCKVPIRIRCLYFSGAVLSYYYYLLFRVYTAISSSFLISILSLSTQSSWSMRYPGSGSQCLSPSTGPIRITHEPANRRIRFNYYISWFFSYRVFGVTEKKSRLCTCEWFISHQMFDEFGNGIGGEII